MTGCANPRPASVLLQEQRRLLLVGLWQGLEQAPLQRQEQVLLQGLVQAQVQGLLRQHERRLLRCEGRVLLRVQMQHREQALLRFDERAQARGPGIRPERGQERPPHPAPYRRLLRVPEQGPHKGQALPQLSGGRGKPGQCRSQNGDTRSQNSRKEKDLEHAVGRSQKLDVRWQKSEVLAAK
jgi:hypothetical protein